MAEFPVLKKMEQMSDEELGKWLIDAYIESEAVNRGMHREIIDETFRQQIRGALLMLDETDARILPLQAALQRAALGDYKQAGAIARSYTVDGAHRQAAVGIIKEEHEKRMRGPREGAKESARRAKDKVAERNNKIVADRARLLATGTAPHEVAGKLAEKYRLSQTQIRDILRKAAEH